MWTVYNADGDAIAHEDDLYEAQLLAEAVNGRIELREKGEE